MVGERIRSSMCPNAALPRLCVLSTLLAIRDKVSVCQVLPVHHWQVQYQEFPEEGRGGTQLRKGLALCSLPHSGAGLGDGVRCPWLIGLPTLPCGRWVSVPTQSYFFTFQTRRMSPVVRSCLSSHPSFRWCANHPRVYCFLWFLNLWSAKTDLLVQARNPHLFSRLRQEH